MVRDCSSLIFCGWEIRQEKGLRDRRHIVWFRVESEHPLLEPLLKSIRTTRLRLQLVVEAMD
jgi:hypothetical protein